VINSLAIAGQEKKFQSQSLNVHCKCALCSTDSSS
jgi:hypothetical protein